jgi:hypothetical protein
MTYAQSFTALGLIALFAIPTPVEAQRRGGRGDRGGGSRVERSGREDRRATGRAVPRGSVRSGRPHVVTVAPYRPYYYRSYGPSLGLGFYSGFPGYYGPYAHGYRGYGYGYPAYGIGAFGYPAYGYPAYGYRTYGRHLPYGGVRIDLPQRDAEVYVDGYFTGRVDDFDGVFQQLNLEPGPHRIEIRAPGFETIAVDVNVEPGRTITYKAAMQPAQP